MNVHLGRPSVRCLGGKTECSQDVNDEALGATMAVWMGGAAELEIEVAAVADDALRERAAQDQLQVGEAERLDDEVTHADKQRFRDARSLRPSPFGPQGR